MCFVPWCRAPYQAMLFKETGITACAFVAVMDITSQHTAGGVAMARRALRLACVVACAVAAVLGRTALTRTSIGPSFSMVDNPHAYETPFATRYVACASVVLWKQGSRGIVTQQLRRLYSLAFLHVRYAFLLVRGALLMCCRVIASFLNVSVHVW